MKRRVPGRKCYENKQGDGMILHQPLMPHVYHQVSPSML